MGAARGELEQPEEPARGAAPRHERGRRPPLAEIDSWELWQAWRRGDREVAGPWLGLMLGFCILLGAMYAFFYYSTVLSNDVVAQGVLLFVLGIFLVWIARRISSRRDFAIYATLAILGVSAAAFGVWYLAFALSGSSPWVAIFGTAVLGLAGLVIGLRGLNALGRARET